MFLYLTKLRHQSVNVDKLSIELNDYPFPDLKDYLLCAFHQGFCLGYTGPCFSITPKNLKSASDNEAHVTDAIAKEVICRHIAGPFKTPPIHPLHCSLLGVVPKKDMSWHLILDLSSLKGLSVNEWISKDDLSVTFSKFDDAMNLVRVAGPGALMAKLDIKHAFRIMPVHPDDWDLLGTCWDGLYLLSSTCHLVVIAPFSFSYLC